MRITRAAILDRIGQRIKVLARTPRIGTMNVRSHHFRSICRYRLVTSMNCLSRFLVALVVFVTIPSLAGADEKSRSFVFRYGAKITGVSGEKPVRIWIPVPPSDPYQRVELAGEHIRGEVVEDKTTKDSKYGNQIRYFAVTPGEFDSIEFHFDYDVRRFEVNALEPARRSSTPSPQILSTTERSLFLSENRKVPITGKPLTLLPGFGDVSSTIDRARRIYDRVDSHVKYDKSKPGYGDGDVLWVCDSRFGNCTDFHSLFISMARSQRIPARFEIGFPLPPMKEPTDQQSGTPQKIGGYHCWASFFDGTRGWIPVDISEADKHPELKEFYFGNLSRDRIGFSRGRDIELQPRQSGPPLNYFIYPHVEVDSKPVDRGQIELKFQVTAKAD